MAPPLSLIVLLMIHGVSSAGWGVSYSPSHICALNDSTVIMRCSYTYPTGHQIMKVFWTKVYKKGVEPPDLSEDPEYSQRLQYLGDKEQNCTVRLSHVTLKDSHKYYFRVITDKEKWLGKPGVTLTVTDLQVESPERVTEGDSVRLTCKSSCTLTDRATFIWSRNSQPLTERRDGNNELLLQSVRREDAGRYSCAVHGHTHTSPDVYLNVTSAGHPVILYVSVGVVCGAAVIFTMLLIWGSRWMKKRKDTQETQMVQSIPHHDKQQVCDVELNEPVYENVTAHQLDDCKSDLNASVYENLPMRL